MLRLACLPVLVLLALAARPTTVWAQRSARAAVSVVVAPPVLAADLLDRAVALAVARPSRPVAQSLPAGARLIASDSPRQPNTRRLTLVFAAN